MKLIRILITLIICNLLSFAAFGENKLKSIRIWPSPENTRVVFDLSKSAKYKVFALDSPNRVVIDLQDTNLLGKMSKMQLSKTRIKKIRIGKRKSNGLRIVLDVDEALTPNSFSLKPNKHYGHRLVVDLEVSEKQKILALFDLDNNTTIATKKSTRELAKATKNDTFLVAIDCGHGGEDPGAIGKLGTKEKDIVLSIGKELKRLLNKEKGIKAFLIRNGDYYVGLRQRVTKARKRKADLLVSIHADSFKNSKATGASVYVLSNRGASSEAAKWLARKENNADLIGGIKLSKRNDSIASVLLDMSQRANNRSSFLAAKYILKKMGGITDLHKNYVEKAGFAVLKAPDIPSILVETGFLSNPRVERRLRSKWYQRKLAASIRDGIKLYYQKVR